MSNASILLGIFGGTFDPPHLGHLALAGQARRQLGLARVLWMLTPDPPHKRVCRLTALEHRLAMVELAVACEPAFGLSTVEIERPGPHYALDTVRILSEREPGAGLVYLMGEDSLRDLSHWYRPADLIAALRILGVMRRPGAATDLAALEARLPGLASRLRWVDAPQVGISASDIRRRVAAGQPFEHLLPAPVAAYIIAHHLYARP